MSYFNNKYSKHYSDINLINKVKSYGKEMGTELTLKILTLSYLVKDGKTPIGVKATIMICLGYVILPTDFIPDFLGPVGWTDDASAVASTIVLVKSYINQDIKSKALVKLNSLMKVREIS